MALLIREIQPGDNAALAAIIRSGIEEFGVPLEGTAHSDPTTDDLYNLFKTPGSRYFVAEEDGVILGGGGIYPTAGLPAGCAELVRFFLAPAARRKGLGVKLLVRASEAAQHAGYTSLYLESFPEMSRAVALYERNGFQYLPAALGNSGHHACTIWMLKTL